MGIAKRRTMDIEQVKKTAQKELDEENFRREVLRYKEILRNRKTIWDLFPYRIIIIKKEK